jgi:hypothetical protein
MRSLRQEKRPELPRVAGQLLVCADLRDAPIEGDHDRVGLADRIVAMGGEQDHLLFGEGRQQVEDLPLPHRVQARGGFIQDDQRRIVIEQSGQRQPLPLTPRQISHAAEPGTHHRLDTVWQRLYRLPQPRQAQHLHDALFLTRCPFTLHRHILPDTEVEVRGVLEEDGLGDRLQRYDLSRFPLRPEFTCRWRNQPGQQLDQRTLARAIGADDRRQTRLERTGEIDERLLLVFRVRVGDPVQRDRSQTLGTGCVPLYTLLCRQGRLFVQKVLGEKGKERSGLVERVEQRAPLVDPGAQHASEPGHTRQEHRQAGQGDLLVADEDTGCRQRQKQAQHLNQGSQGAQPGKTCGELFEIVQVGLRQPGMFPRDQIAPIDAHIALPGGIDLHVGQYFHAQLVGGVMLLQFVHGATEAPLDQASREGDERHGDDQQRHQGQQGHGYPDQSQEDGHGGEQRVHQGDGLLRRLANDQAVTGLKGIVLEEGIGHLRQLLHDPFADDHLGLLAQDGGGAVAQDNAQALYQKEPNQNQPGDGHR